MLDNPASKPHCIYRKGDNMTKLDLDVASPHEAIGVLREAAQQYYESSGELESSWQSKVPATQVWAKFAKVLESAADRMEKIELRTFGHN